MGRKFRVHIQQSLEYELVLLFCKEGEIELIVKRWEKYCICNNMVLCIHKTQ